jgi:hypothetical protein
MMRLCMSRQQTRRSPFDSLALGAGLLLMMLPLLLLLLLLQVFVEVNDMLAQHPEVRARR